MIRMDKNTVFNEVCEHLNSEGFNGIAKVLEMLTFRKKLFKLLYFRI